MNRHFIFILAAFTFVWHCTATVLYLIPANPMTAYYHGIVRRYMEPLFAQNWNLFAPEPATSSLQLWYRCESQNNAWTPWLDPVSRLITEHRATRFTSRGKLIYVYQSVARQALNRYVQQFKGDHQKFKTDKSYRLAARLVHDLCKKTTAPARAQFQVVKVFSPDFSERYAKKFGSMQNTIFETVEL